MAVHAAEPARRDAGTPSKSYATATDSISLSAVHPDARKFYNVGADARRESEPGNDTIAHAIHDDACVVMTLVEGIVFERPGGVPRIRALVAELRGALER